ncbi:MAG TPA: thiamine phosphate synthase, partial [Polyangiaceae bacterium]|nr:thiamine phosphate synthase [Polyangiaceae bacterium]
PRLVVLSDTTRVPIPLMLERFAIIAQRALPASVQFTLRDYALPLRDRLALGEQLAALSRRTRQRFAVAERADLARAWGCRAFHLPESGLRAADARRYLGPAVMLSRGCHDPTAAIEPELDAVLLSPIFEARKGRSALGVTALTSARAAHARPAWYALGGVDASNASACLAAGAAGVAVIGAALSSDPEPLLSALGILKR